MFLYILMMKNTQKLSLKMEQTIPHRQALLFSLLLLSLFTLGTSELCHPHDKQVLLKIKQHFGNKLQRWNPATDCCKYWDDMLKCDENGHVIFLFLASKPEMSGDLPPEFGDLTTLQSFGLIGLDFTGSIPSSLAKLTNLELLVITNTSMKGPVPQSLSQLKKLKTVVLSDSPFTGDLSFLFQRNRTTLEEINISNCDFKFDFTNLDPPQFLRSLNISHNMIYGSLPKRLGQLPLRSIDVSYNQLCGRIPTGRRLKRFSPVFFGHNNGLCGLPLAPCM